MLDLPDNIFSYISVKSKLGLYVVVGFTMGENKEHYMPQWMSPKLHIIIEDVLMKIFPQYTRNRYNIIYHILMGLNCGYSMREIIWFIVYYSKA